jgi:hypothetical protein
VKEFHRKYTTMMTMATRTGTAEGGRDVILMRLFRAACSGAAIHAQPAS